MCKTRFEVEDGDWDMRVDDKKMQTRRWRYRNTNIEVQIFGRPDMEMKVWRRRRR